VTPEQFDAFAARRERHARLYAAVLDDPEGRQRAYGAAMVALAFCASAEGFPRFRRWLLEKPAQLGLPGEVTGDPSAWTPQSVNIAAQVFAAWTILDYEDKKKGS
jgi:hypothetical protein